MKVLNVQKLIETQSQKYKDRLLSQYSRMLDLAPSFPTYYSIDGMNSTVEIGSRDIMDYVADDSPVKFKKILNMPFYSANAITADITYDDTLGTFTEFEDEGLLLNSVLKPLPGDHLIFKEFNPEIIFIITDVKIRAIRGEDHYVPTYSVVQTSRIKNIERQVVETYETIFRNIGTEDNVLIRQSDYNDLRNYMEAYRIIHERYIDENYDKEISYLKTPEWLEDTIGYGTCKYLMKYLMNNRIVFFDEILESIFAFEDVLPFDTKHNKLYNRTFPLHSFIKKSLTSGSIYISFKEFPMSLIKEVYNETVEQSIEFKFVEKEDEPTYVVGYKEILLYNSIFIDKIISKDYANLTPLERVIAKFINDEEIIVKEFEDIVDDYAVSDLFRYYFIPLALTILKVKIKSLQAGRNI